MPASWWIFLRLPLRMYRLAAREHRHELLNFASTSLRPFNGLDAMENRVAVLAGEPCEHRLRLRLSRKRSCQVVGHVRGRGTGVGSPPTTVSLRALDLGDSGRLHPALADQPLGEPRIPLRPAAPRPSWRETLEVRALVAAADLAVDPPETDRLLEGLVLGEARRGGSALLRQYEHDAGPIGVVASEPLTPSAHVRDHQLAAFTADRVLLALG